MADIEDTVIVVTGASRGLGREMALRFAEEGARVVLTARNREDLADATSAASGETLAVPGDVTDEGDIRDVVEEATRVFGPIDTLVNNAAVGLLSLEGEGKRLVDLTEADWDVVLDTNLKGVFLFTRAVLPDMLERGRGNIVNVTSGLGRGIMVHDGAAWAPYTVSKWGLEALTRVTDAEYHDAGINANALGPGGRARTGFWDHLPAEELEEILPADVMNEAAVYLAAQGPGGYSGESLDAPEWEARFENTGD